MSFMECFTYGPMLGWQVESNNGTEFIPGDVHSVPEGFEVGAYFDYDEDAPEQFEELCSVLQDYCGGKITSIEVIHGYFGRYSAPGYTDCTPWSFDADEDVLIAELDEYYGDEEEGAYQVICGNIGTVYSGSSELDAGTCFDEYVEESKLPHGRASGESVTLFYDGEVIEEYIGTLAREEPTE